jgi:hypothetical protein
MDRDEFLSEFSRMMEANGIFLGNKADNIIDIVFEDEPDPVFGNIFAGSLPRQYLLVTAEASYAFQTKLFGVKVVWIVGHAALAGDAWHRRGMAGGYVLDEVVLQHQDGTESFWMGYSDPRGAASASRQIAQKNCEVAARQINLARGLHTASSEPAGPLVFDPAGPEDAAAAAKDAYQSGGFVEALRLFVMAVDRLHDFYVFEEFRNRQPSPRDAWIVNGVGAALCAARAQDRGVDVRGEVREATHRLRTIASAVERAGGNAVLYRSALDELAQCAPDVDVSDIYWS